MLKEIDSYPQLRPPTAALILENGNIFWGYGIGAKNACIAELCFNTSQTGYQEILTDPSYAKQIITFTFPHVGIVGSNEIDIESKQTRGYGIRDVHENDTELFLKLTVSNSQTLTALIKCLRNPVKTWEDIADFRFKLRAIQKPTRKRRSGEEYAKWQKRDESYCIVPPQPSKAATVLPKASPTWSPRPKENPPER